MQKTLCRLDYFLVTEWVEQADYSSAVFTQTTNTVRLFTVRRRGRERAILATAIQRFGRRSSAPTDNVSRGGLSVRIEPSTGTLGKAVSLPDRGELVWYSHHPDTGAAIEGVRIPRWNELRDQVLTAANTLSFLPYVGWDAIPTENGCTILEGNHSPAFHSLQVHGPLLVDPDIRAFLKEEGVLDGRVRRR